jgi:hypothetical protein
VILSDDISVTVDITTCHILPKEYYNKNTIVWQCSECRKYFRQLSEKAMQELDMYGVSTEGTLDYSYEFECAECFWRGRV